MDIYDLALTLTPRIGNSAARHIIETFGSARAAFEAPLEELIRRGEINPLVAKSIVGQVAIGAARAEMEHCRRHGITAIAATDPDYPRLLLDTSDRPHVLFAMGRTELLNYDTIAFVGTRQMSPYGERAAIQIIRELSEKIDKLVIVSGIAYGVDAASHRAALKFDVPTIAVLPNPLPAITPALHTNLAREIISKGGLLITEQRSTLRNVGRTFIARNRIIAGISSATVVVESGAKGGSISTAKNAYDNGRLVMAVPGRITDSSSFGCNKLIADGIASPLYSTERFVFSLGWQDRSPHIGAESVAEDGFDLSVLSEDLLGLLKCFRHDEPLHISTLQELTSLSVGELCGMLMELEIYGFAKSLSGAFYERVIPYKRLK
ncbi:MAG: DNA-processing protein DprA [Rikenellaceae bacterium]